MVRQYFVSKGARANRWRVSRSASLAIRVRSDWLREWARYGSARPTFSPFRALIRRRTLVVAEYGIPPGANPCGDIAVADGRVQVSSCRVVPSIAVIDPESGAVQVVELEGLAVAVAVVDGQAWWAVQQPGDGTSQLVQLGRGSAPPTLVSVPGVAAIGGVVVAFDSIWVSDEANGTVTRLPMSLLG